VRRLVEALTKAYSDPTSNDPQWLTCDFAPMKTLAQSVSLAAIKADPRLATLALVCQPRLAVMPVAPEQFRIIVEELGQPTSEPANRLCSGPQKTNT
jgi:predicted RNA-binding protein with PUA-like domain